jgi:hypothetical protein
MRGFFACVLLYLGTPAFAQQTRSLVSFPDHLVIARHTYLDYGLPSDYYELFLINQKENGTSVERVVLTPTVNTCFQPGKSETGSVLASESVQELLGSKNPCDISEQDIRRELKRNKGPIYTEADVAIQVTCGSQSRAIRADIVGKELLGPTADTPPLTSWMLQFLARLDKLVGPGVMDEPPLSASGEQTSTAGAVDSPTLADVGSGKYDDLFRHTLRAPDKPSDVYRASRVSPPAPSVRLTKVSPAKPDVAPLPEYPPLAKLARVEGPVSFRIDVDTNGNSSNFRAVTGHPMLLGAVEQAVGAWKFPREAAGQQVDATIEFATNCSKQK